MRPYETLNETDWEQVERIHELLDEGEVDQARGSLERLRRGRTAQPDLRIVEATLCLEEGEPGQALAALAGAERSADPAQFFHLRAAAQYDLVRFEDARADAERALAIHADYAFAWDLLSRVCEHLADAEGAAEAAARAHELDPDGFPLPLEVADEEFDRMVERSVRELPAAVRQKLDELPVVVQGLPAREMLTAEEPPLTPDLLGLFVGRHIFAESASAPPTAPGVIYLFRRNLLRACSDLEELAREIGITVRHEVGHLMGLDEEELDDWGLA
ncbi:MAG TPA: metallopeptidase family protein [Candidatus Acidoferrales bacterium]|nr:metallopeptidase family protein [Candidatus Acidoferrales bacterium]